jgi:glyoxylase-like metal-dependent hydrolase (beta-lactamase superfamily II)
MLPKAARPAAHEAVETFAPGGDMQEAIPEYEVFAIRYATREARWADHFTGGDPHDGPVPMDHFVWLIRGAGRAVVVDTGFTAEVAAPRKPTFLRCPVEALGLFGVDPAAVEHVVLTHLHYNHVGNFSLFPTAEFQLHEPEMQHTVGRHMSYRQLAHSFEVKDVVGVVRLSHAHRVRFRDGRAELPLGITLHPAPGHSVGLQFVRVNTNRDPVVLASDVTHFYENMKTERPFTAVFRVGGVLEGYDFLRAAAPTTAHIVPGHDLLMMHRYPPPSPELAGIAVRLDVAPLAAPP